MSQPAAATKPFWGWLDAALFLALIAPCGVAALLLTKGLNRIFPLPSQLSFLLAFQFIGYGIWLSSLYALLHLRYRRPFWESMAWKFPWRGAGATVLIGPVLAFAVGVGAYVLRTPEVNSELQAMMKDRFSIVLVGVFSATLGPVCEELVFRGFFQPLLIRQFGTHLGVLLCAAPFAVLHGPQYHWTWQIIVLLTLAGAVFGYTRLRTGSTAASTTVHAAYNLTYFTAYIAQQKDLYF